MLALLAILGCQPEFTPDTGSTPLYSLDEFAADVVAAECETIRLCNHAECASSDEDAAALADNWSAECSGFDSDAASECVELLGGIDDCDHEGWALVWDLYCAGACIQ